MGFRRGAALFFLFLFMRLLFPSSSEGKDVLSSGGKLNRTIAFTFDDGPHEKLTPLLLDTLASLNVRATFFLVGAMAEKRPAIVREIFARGHTLANHSYSHGNSVTMSDEALLADLEKCSAVIRGIIPGPVRFFRPPGGDYNKKTIETVKRAKMKIVLWDINSRDYTGVSPEFITKRIVRKAVPGSILLFHSGVPATIKALPEIVRQLRKKRYEFVTLDEMFSSYIACVP